MKMPHLQRRTFQFIGIVFCLLALARPGKAEPTTPIAAGSPIAGLIRYQFAIYYLGSPPRSPMSVLQSRLKLTEQPPKLVASIPDRPAVPLVQATLNTDVQKTYAPPSPDALQRFGRGLTRDQALAMRSSQQALILDFAHPQSSSLSAYRSSLQLTEQIARDTDGLLWDEETREVFSPDEWHKRRLDGWDGGIPDLQQHTVIHAYKGDKLVRAITLGMAKFGLPDVVVSDFSWSSNRPMGNLISLFSQAMLEGGSIGAQGFYDLDVRSIRHASVRKSQLDALKPKSVFVAKLVLVKGTPEAGDPHNRLVEIQFDRYQGPDRYARQDALLDTLFGSEDSVQRVRHNEELLAASRTAKSRLSAVREAFNRGLQPGEYVLVKAPFKIPEGGREWMWVEVTAWDGDAISGLLKNEPFNIPNLHGGQMVKVSQEEVFDYVRRDAAGREEGNETGKILQRMQGATKK